MTVARTADLMALASSNGSAVFAFNVITLEHAEAVVTGAERSGTGVIVQVSENTVRFHGGQLSPLVCAVAHLAKDSSVPVAIHLDHIKDVDLIVSAIDAAGTLEISSIMVDAAHLAFEANVHRTREAVQRAHSVGLYVEAELGEVGGKPDAHAVGARTDPTQASTFVTRTGVDALAVAVGSEHAMTTRDAQIDLGLVEELRVSVPVPLVLHGGSGVSDDLVAHAVGAGIRKVNVGTALNVVYTGAIREVLASQPSVTDPRKYLGAARDSTADRVARMCAGLRKATGVLS